MPLCSQAASPKWIFVLERLSFFLTKIFQTYREFERYRRAQGSVRPWCYLPHYFLPVVFKSYFLFCTSFSLVETILFSLSLELAKIANFQPAQITGLVRKGWFNVIIFFSLSALRGTMFNWRLSFCYKCSQALPIPGTLFSSFNRHMI